MLAKKAPLVVLDLRGSDLEVSVGLVGSTSFDMDLVRGGEGVASSSDSC
jgi:hypothetical protein